MKTIQEILDAAEPKILERGKQYYKQGKILSLEKNRTGGCLAAIAGNGEIYSVAVQQDRDGHVTAMSCNCPYASGDLCKHMVAVLLALQNSEREQDFTERTTAVNAAEGQAADWIAEIPGTVLRKFVTDYARRDEAFENELKFAVGFPDEKKELAAVKEQIKIAVRAGTHRGYIDWRGCDNICAKLDELLKYAQKRLERGYLNSAYQVIDTVLQKAMYLASYADSSNGSVTQTVGFAEELLQAVCDKAAETADKRLQNKFFEKLLRLAKKKCFNGWSENVYTILRIAAKVADKKSAVKLMSFLDTMRTQNSSDYDNVCSKFVIIELTEKLEGHDAARKLLYEDLTQDDFRREAYNWAMTEKDWPEAIRLCQDKLSQMTETFEKSKWLERMANACKSGGERGLLEETLKELVLCGQTEYYDQYKSLLQEDGTWEQEYPAFRDSWYTKLFPSQSMPLLIKENETALLMDAAEKNPSSIVDYGKFLVKVYPQRVYCLFKKLINSEEKRAQNRQDYRRICMLTKKLHELGGTVLALEVLDQLSQKYPHRPAMQEEIQKARSKIVCSAEKP